jgi:epoxyqueuosine reductase
MTLQEQILARANELGLTDIGMIGADAMDGYMERVRERIGKIPNGQAVYGWIQGLRQTHPWAKSLIVIAVSNVRYRVPPQMENRFGKHYQFDSRVGHSKERIALIAFGEYLQTLDIRSDGNNVMGYRWAAMAAGLGILRRNNFFYGEDGSNYSLSAWATDAELEYIQTPKLSPCPENCDRCVHACPTGALSAPYTIDMSQCVSRLTTNCAASPAPDDIRNEQIGQWIYGCDSCQDVCPRNFGKRTGQEDYPHLSDIAPYGEPLRILQMSYDEIAQILMPQFFYLKEPELWKFKVNALNVLANAWKEEYVEAVEAMCSDTSEQVQEKAKYILERNQGKEKKL